MAPRPEKSMKKAFLILFAVLVLGALILFSLSIIAPKKDAYVAENLPSSPINGDPRTADAQSSADPAAPLPAELSLEDRLVAELKKYYSDTIAKKSTQAGLLKVRDYIVAMFPEDGEARFYDILKRAFPGLADEIMMTLKKMDDLEKTKEISKKLSEYLLAIIKELK